MFTITKDQAIKIAIATGAVVATFAVGYGTAKYIQRRRSKQDQQIQETMSNLAFKEKVDTTTAACFMEFKMKEAGEKANIDKSKLPLVRFKMESIYNTFVDSDQTKASYEVMQAAMEKLVAEL